MSTYGPREPRTNKEVARIMWASGWAALAVGAVMALTNNWFVEEIFETGRTTFNAAVNVWMLVLQLLLPLGTALIVGSIIVRRLPERPTE